MIIEKTDILSSKIDTNMNEWDKGLKGWLTSQGMGEMWAILLVDLFWLAVVLAISWLVYYIVRKAAVKIASSIPTKLGEALLYVDFFKKACYIIPLSLVGATYDIIFSDMPKLVALLDKVISILFVIYFVKVINAIAKAIIRLYQQKKESNDRPVKSLIQFTLIIIYVVAFIIIVSILFGKPPAVLIGGLSAMSAVLMLIFKDSILGLVSSVQVSTNDMVNVGDWIVMPKYSTDGEVIDITLTTVKVQNWDKSISMVPTYALVSDAVINWKGMYEAGGRRIARSINIDMRSVCMCTEEMLEQFKKMVYISDYIETVQESLDEHNKSHGFDMSVPVNGIRQTNLGVFRAYMTAYLRNNPDLNQEMTLMVRLLGPTETGIPVQIYCFTKSTSWEPYEKAQSDIFEHLLCVLPYFGLTVYQNIGGEDLNKLNVFNKD